MSREENIAVMKAYHEEQTIQRKLRTGMSYNEFVKLCAKVNGLWKSL
mgnify:CR=1 FL=1